MTESNHSLILVLIMMVTGIFGGCTNYALLSTEEKAERGRYVLVKSILIGLAASFLVPLFLTTISSSILDPGSSPFPEKNYFIFSGFCLLAAIVSKRFIEDLYSRVVKAEKTAREAKQEAVDAQETIKALEDERIEPDEPTILTSQLVEGQSDGNISKVFNAFQGSRYAYRSISGLQRDTGIGRGELVTILAELEKEGQIESRQSRKGHKVWKIKI